jgi:hypothetical protein
VDPAKLEIHPAAAVFPLLEDAEFQALVEDIKNNGQHNPILLDAEGRVLLDGRRRLRACLTAGVEPRFERWSGPGSPTDLIISLNVRRRHLNESQRALVAARLAPQLERYPKDAQCSANWRNTGRAGRAAVMLNVSPRSVVRALKVLNSGNAELLQAVESGNLSISAAARKVEPPRQQPKRASPRPQDPVVVLWGQPATTLEPMLPVLQRWGFQYRLCRWADLNLRQ